MEMKCLRRTKISTAGNELWFPPPTDMQGYVAETKVPAKEWWLTSFYFLPISKSPLLSADGETAVQPHVYLLRKIKFHDTLKKIFMKNNYNKFK